MDKMETTPTEKKPAQTIMSKPLSERGIGGSRRAGEQAAASAMLQTIKAKIKS